MSTTLRFWVECEVADRQDGRPEKTGVQLVAEILRKFEGATRGDIVDL
jgi:hypothetical protein